MSNLILSRNFNGFTVSQRKSDGYWNLNEMADSVGKRISDWMRLDSTKESIIFFEGRSQDQKEHTADLRYAPKALDISKANSKHGGGTWAHPDIAIDFAMWCSLELKFLVLGWIRELLTTGKVELIATEPKKKYSYPTTYEDALELIWQQKDEIHELKLRSQDDTALKLQQMKLDHQFKVYECEHEAKTVSKTEKAIAVNEIKKDSIRQFVDFCLVQCDRSYEIDQDVLYDRYTKFCRQAQLSAFSQNSFTAHLRLILPENNVARSAFDTPTAKARGILN